MGEEEDSYWREVSWKLGYQAGQSYARIRRTIMKTTTLYRWQDTTSYGQAPDQRRGTKEPDQWTCYYAGFRLSVWRLGDCWMCSAYGTLQLESVELVSSDPADARLEAIQLADTTLRKAHEQVLNHRVTGP